MRCPSKAATFGAASSLVTAVFVVVSVAHGSPGPSDEPVRAVTARFVDYAAQQAYQESAVTSFGEGAASVALSFSPVPAGKRLVIEHVTVEAQVPVGETARCAIVTHLDDGAVAHTLVMHDQGVVPDPPFDRQSFVASQSVRLYGSQGAAPAVSVFRTSPNGPAPVLATISGYLVDVP
jgi:hypothetical protein